MDLSVAEGKLTLHVRGADKLWALKSSLEIPLVHIAGVRADPEVARNHQSSESSRPSQQGLEGRMSSQSNSGLADNNATTRLRGSVACDSAVISELKLPNASVILVFLLFHVG